MAVTRRLAVAGLVSAATAACGGGGVPGGGRPLVIATGSPLGVYYSYGKALAGLLRPRTGPVTVMATSASVENIRLVTGGGAQLAFTAVDAAADAADGRPPFTGTLNVQALARLYDDYIHLVVPATSPVLRVADLRGLRVSIGSAGSGTALIAGRVLAADGMDSVRDVRSSQLDLTDSVAALQQRTIDAFFWSGGLPTFGIDQLTRSMAVRLVPMPGEAVYLRNIYGPVYRSGTIPAGTYPSVDNVDTIAVADLLVAAPTMDADLAAQVTGTLFAGAAALARGVPNGDQLDVRTAIFTEPIPLHPGALRYYRGAKLED